jgi:hypothetical protein
LNLGSASYRFHFLGYQRKGTKIFSLCLSPFALTEKGYACYRSLVFVQAAEISDNQGLAPDVTTTL